MSEWHAIQIPFTANISTSAGRCFCDGNPPYTTIIVYKCTADATIWTLRPLPTDFCVGVEIRDPTRNYRRMGPTLTRVDNDDGTDDSDLADTEVLRFRPGESTMIEYTFSTRRKAGGLRHDDFHNLTAGNMYELTIRRQRWRWMFESEMPENCILEDGRALLAEQDAVEWKPESKTSFILVE